ncbi:mitogen-activated protein kinase 15-like [Primulina eburnea]|uniref:mitogen-activated protein kinase 15-like n=1 Tax=Primulina eburnea TaxID=1245227 RepID=UPI003C6BE41F
MQQQDQKKKISKEIELFTEYGEANRYRILEIVGKGSYGVVCAAIDTHTGEKVAIKKITNIFDHISDAIRILREIKLLRLLHHPDIVEIKRIMLPPSRRDFRDIYVVFELMESDLHQVIKANDDLTHDHHRFFLYQMLRALKYMHTANVYHRDLKPKNILANANCKLKICDFGLARVAFNDTPTTIFWTDYIATRWYRAPELCGSFFSKYTPAIDVWSIGCIFAEVLTGKPLFPGKSVAHQLELITDFLGTPSADTISGVRDEKARKYLSDVKKKYPVTFTNKFPNADPLALKLLKRLLAFDPKDRPSAEEALADPYFRGLAKIEREPCCQPILKMEFEFERRRVTKEDIRELIFREILEYHPQLLKDHMAGNGGTSFLYPSAIGHFKKQFAYLEGNFGKSGPVIPPEKKHDSLPRSTVTSTIPPRPQPTMSAFDHRKTTEAMSAGLRVPDSNSGNISSILRPPPRVPNANQPRVMGPVLPSENGSHGNDYYGGRVLPQSISPHHILRTSFEKNQDKCTIEAEMEASQVKQQYMPVKFVNGMRVDTNCQAQSQEYNPAKLKPGMNNEINSNPYLQPQAQIGTLISQIPVATDLLKAQTQFVANGAASQRKIGVAVEIGLT